MQTPANLPVMLTHFDPLHCLWVTNSYRNWSSWVSKVPAPKKGEPTTFHVVTLMKRMHSVTSIPGPKGLRLCKPGHTLLVKILLVFVILMTFITMQTIFIAFVSFQGCEEGDAEQSHAQRQPRKHVDLTAWHSSHLVYMPMVHPTGDTHDPAVLHWAGAVVVQLTDLTYFCLR